MKPRFNRRSFLTATSSGGAALLILDSSQSARGYQANEKLNLAVIGAGGRGAANLSAVASENIVALCDVNEGNLAAAAKRFPKAKTYFAWRKMLDLSSRLAQPIYPPYFKVPPRTNGKWPFRRP